MKHPHEHTSGRQTATPRGRASLAIALMLCASVAGAGGLAAPALAKEAVGKAASTQVAASASSVADGVVGSAGADAVGSSPQVENPVVNPFDSAPAPSEGLEFTSNGDGTCMITGVGTCTDDVLVIPSVSDAGEAVTGIDSNAFSYLKADELVLYGVNLSIDKNAFSSAQINQIVIVDSTITTDDNAFAYDDDTTSLTVIDSTLDLGEYAFYGTGDRMTVGMSGSTVTLEESAFSSAEVSDVTLYDCDLTADDNALAYNDRLESLSLLNTRADLGKYALYESGDDAVVTVTGGTLTAGKSAFSSMGLVSVDISGCAVDLGDNALAYNDDLTTVSIVGGPVSLGKYAIYSDGRLATVTIDAGEGNELELGEGAISSDDELTDVTIGNGQIKLAQNAIAYNDALESVTFGASIASKRSRAVASNADGVQIAYAGNTYDEKGFDALDPKTVTATPIAVAAGTAGAAAAAAGSDVEADGSNDAEAATETPVAEVPTPASTATGDFRDLMDGYETFMNDYVDFMLAYESSGDPASMLQDLSTLMSDYASWSAQIGAIDVNSLSPDDYAYYMQVTARVLQRLSELA